MEDFAEFYTFVDYDDFFDTYFAPKRAIAAVGWEHLSLGEFMYINTAIIAQMDFTEAENPYNNQYLVFKAGIPIDNYLIEIGGGVETSQSDKNGLAFAAEFGFYWMIPASFNNRLSAVFKFASGGTDDLISPFTPITTKYYGNLVKQKISGLSIFTLDYTARFTHGFGVSLSGSYFVRNDLSASEGYFLGPEAFLLLVWSPFSDVHFSLGGGAFFPSLGDGYPDRPFEWKAELTTTITF